MLNLGELREVKIRVLASVMHSQILFAYPVLTKTLESKLSSRKKMTSEKRVMVIRIVSAFSTVFKRVVLVVSSVDLEKEPAL